MLAALIAALLNIEHSLKSPSRLFAERHLPSIIYGFSIVPDSVIVKAKIIKEHNCPHVLINNAGTAIRKVVSDLSLSEWNKVMDINVDNEDDAGSHAAAAYTATGYLDTKEATYTSTRVLGIQGYYINNNNQGSGGGDEGDGTTGPGTTLDADNANDTSGDPPGNGWGGDNNDYSGDVEADGGDQSGGGGHGH